MIAVERPSPETGYAALTVEPREAQKPAGGDPHPKRSARSWRSWPEAMLFGGRGTAILVTLALLAGITSSAGLLDGGIALGLQARADAMQARWAVMREQGVPESDLALMEQQWVYTQKIKYLGAGAVFWSPGSSSIVNRWESESAAVYARDLSVYRAGAAAADQNLHAALGTEPWVQRKARLDALASAVTPGDFVVLRVDWDLGAKLVPIDRNIALAAAALADQMLQAKNLGIRSDPGAESLARADGYSQMGVLDRIARAELLTRNLGVVRKDLQGRIDAAGGTQQAFTHAGNEISVASLYGIDLSGYQPRIDANHAAYGNAGTVAEFNQITGDLNQIASAADSAIYAALSTTHVISGVTFYYQDHSLSCEEAATSMALTHQGIFVSQDQILAELGADRRPMYRDSSGRVRWGNPYETFVGNVDGSESNFTGYGTYYPPLVRIASAHGARLIAYGSMSAATIYARVIAGHPVVAFATWDWAWHPRHDYLSFDGQWIPFIGPVQASHVYTVVGVSPSAVLINDPLRGQYWLGKGAFEAGYSDFNEAIVFA